MDYSKILFMSDMDGTLTVDGKLSAENETAIREFQSRGGLFAPATGRSFHYIKEEFSGRLTPNAPFATINGGIIYTPDGNEVLWHKPIAEGYLPIAEFIRSVSKPVRVLACTEDETFDILTDKHAVDQTLKIVTVTQTVEEATALRDMLNERFGDTCRTGRSWPTGVETMNRLAGKGVCAEIIKKLTNAEICIAMGDYENDFTLLESADIGIAVGNALDSVKKRADLVTVPAEDNAVAHVLSNIESIVANYQR